VYFPSCHRVFRLFGEGLCLYIDLQESAYWNPVFVGLSILIPPEDDNVANKDTWQSDICIVFETIKSVLFNIISRAQVQGVLQLAFSMCP